jgi:hypothetical protein
MIVTPGIELSSVEGPISKEQLDLLGKPTVSLEDGDVSAEHIDLPGLVNALGTGTAGLNYLRNGNFAEPLWGRGATPVSCPVGLRTYRADDWFATPAGAAITYERDTEAPDFRSLHTAKLTGATGATTVDFAQDIPGHIAAALQTNFTLSFYLLNNTGGDVTPEVRIATANGLNNFNSMINRYAESVDEPAATSNWKKWTLSIDGSTFPNMANGMRLAIRLPEGTLSSGSKSVNFSQIKLEISETATPFVVDPAERAEEQATGTGLVRNYLENGNFAENRWKTSVITCRENEYDYLAESWWARPAGAAGMLYARDVDAPDLLSLTSAKLTGAAGTSDVDFGQNLSRQICAETRRTMVWSMYVKNNTGADFYPIFRINTCNAEDSFGAVTNQLSDTLQLCANGAWTRVSYTFTGTDYGNWINGAQLVIRIPNGSMDGPGKSVKLAQGRLEQGVSLTPAYTPGDPGKPVSDLNGAASNLRITWISDTEATILADEIVLKDPAGNARSFSNVSTIIDTSALGIGGLDTGIRTESTWYDVWLIASSVDVSGLLSAYDPAQPSKEPIMPMLYNFRARVGQVFVDETHKLRKFAQLGKRCWWAGGATGGGLVNSLFHGQVGVTAYTSILTTAPVNARALIAPRAIRLFGLASCSGPGSRFLFCADMGTKIGEVVVNTATSTPWDAGGGNMHEQTPFQLPLLFPQNFFWRSENNSPDKRVMVNGFELP